MSSKADQAHLANFQASVRAWCVTCFGEEVANDLVERTHRFFEEATELCQSLGMRRDDADVLLDYVFSRPPGEPVQEVGGTIVTLASLCAAKGISLDHAAVTELTRIRQKVEAIRAKHATKPRHSPLPGKSPDEAGDDGSGYRLVLAFPDESQSFATGFEAGILWNRMGRGEAVIDVTTRVETNEVLRRMAVAKGYDLSLTASGVEGWNFAKLTVGKAPPKTPNPHGLKAV